MHIGSRQAAGLAAVMLMTLTGTAWGKINPPAIRRASSKGFGRRRLDDRPFVAS